jgi:hypothetical protein
MPPKIELAKTRDFGEIISDTFVFIKENLKPLLQNFFTLCGIFIIAGAITAVIQQSKMVGMVNNSSLFQPRASNLFNNPNPFGFLGIEYFLSIFFIMLGYIAMHVTILSFIALYKEKGNVAPTTTEVWAYFKYFYFKIFGSAILIFLLIIFATVLCFFPGVYLYPIMALVLPIMIFENTSFSYAFNRSFRLIKDNWWLTFGCIFVSILIVYFASLIILIPTTIINLSSMFLHPHNGIHMSLTTTIISTVLQQVCQVFGIIPLVVISLCYFSLNEKANGTGLIERLSQLGNNTPDDTLSTEEY